MSADLPEVVRLLIVGGDERQRADVQRALRKIDWPTEATPARSVEEALELSRARSVQCLVLLRPGEPERLELLRRLRAADDITPVLVLAGRDEAQTAVDLLQAGATDVSVQDGDLDPQRLWQRVRQAVRIARAEQTARQAQEAQQRSEELLRLIVDSVPPLIAYIDRGYRYRWNNRQYQEWFGVHFQGAGSQSVSEVLGEAAFAAVKPYLDRALAGETVTFQRELPYRAGPRWVEATYVPHVGPGGAIEGLVVLVQDIGDRRAEEERRQRQADFEQQLLGIVSHDLRNPISVISMNAAMLQRREDTPPWASKPLARILSSADRASRMVRDLLDFTQARLGGGITINPRPVDLHEVTRQVVDEVQTAFPDRQIRFEAQGDGRGRWDPDRLGQIVANLVTNALSYSPADTVVTVATGPAGPRPDGAGHPDQDALVLEVHNHGPAIPPEAIPALFQPFKRGPDRRQDSQRSVGLGLHIVRHLVDAHGGRIEIESGAETGTRFRVCFPRLIRG